MPEAFIYSILSVIINFMHPVGADPLYKTKEEILNQLTIIFIGITGFIILAVVFIVILKILIH